MFRHFMLGIGVFMVGLFIIMSAFNLQLINLSEIEDEIIIEQVRNRDLEQLFSGENRAEIKEEIITEFDWEQKIDDDYILNKAKDLGMVFPQFNLADIFNEPRNNPTTFSYDSLFFLPESIDDDDWLKEYEVVKSDLEEETKVNNSSGQKKISILIKPGMQAREIAWLLEEKDLIADAHSFILLIDKLELADKMKAGSYQISTDISSFELLLQLI